MFHFCFCCFKTSLDLMENLIFGIKETFTITVANCSKDLLLWVEI